MKEANFPTTFIILKPCIIDIDPRLLIFSFSPSVNMFFPVWPVYQTRLPDATVWQLEYIIIPLPIVDRGGGIAKQSKEEN